MIGTENIEPLGPNDWEMVNAWDLELASAFRERMRPGTTAVVDLQAFLPARVIRQLVLRCLAAGYEAHADAPFLMGLYRPRLIVSWPDLNPNEAGHRRQRITLYEACDRLGEEFRRLGFLGHEPGQGAYYAAEEEAASHDPAQSGGSGAPLSVMVTGLELLVSEEAAADIVQRGISTGEGHAAVVNELRRAKRDKEV